jgi:hypothetical protein
MQKTQKVLTSGLERGCRERREDVDLEGGCVHALLVLLFFLTLSAPAMLATMLATLAAVATVATVASPIEKWAHRKSIIWSKNYL